MAEIKHFTSKEAQKEISSYKKELTAIAKLYASIAKNANILIKAQNNEKKSTEQLTASQKESLRLQKQLETTKAKNAQLTSKTSKELIKQKVILQQQTKALRDQAKAAQGIKKTNGLFKSLTKGILAAGVAMFGLQAAFRVLKNAGKLVREFQKENAVLAGVLNKTRAEVSELTKNAERLGATTAKTAKEITGLQIAYARLGFSQEEILNLTADTINGSIALNAELSETAELTGAMVRSFDELKTTDADLILDQLTLSTQKTALNFQKLQTSLPIVAGAASAAGVQFKTVVAQLGQAADRGIDASTAATSLRNIYIELAKKGITLEEALDKINNSQNKLTEANKLFGKRAAVTALALAKTTDKTNELEIALGKAGGTAEKVAKEQLDTLDGSIKLLTSAWEGFILSIENGDGAIAKLVNGSLKKFAAALTQLSNLDLIFARTSKLTAEQISRTYDALNAMQNRQGLAFQQFVKEYSDVSAQWLAINKKTALELLDDLGFSNKESELLFTEHLGRLVNQEKTAAIAAEQARLESERRKQEELDKLRAFELQKAGNRLKQLDKIESEALEIGIDGITELTITQEILLDRQKKAQEEYDAWFLQSQKDKWANASNLVSMFSGFAIDSINGIFQFQLQSIDNELDSLDSFYQTKINAASNNGQNTIQLETEFNLKRKQLEDDRAKSEKQAAIVSIGLTYAQTAFEIIAQAAALSANPLTIALSPIAWAQLGALTVAQGVQLAAVSQFDKGTGSTPGVYIGGEGDGSELRRDAKTGNWSLLTGATLFTDNPGDTIISTKETEAILNGSSMRSSTSQQFNDANIVSAINNIPAAPFINSKGYNTIRDRRGNETKWISKRIRN